MNEKTLLVTAGKAPRALEEAVRGLDLEAKTVHSYAEAEAELKEHPEYAVVVADVTLPDGNWYSVMRRLVHKGSQAAFFVMLDAGCDPGCVLGHGVTGVLRRPVNAEIARKKLEEALPVRAQ